MGAYVGALIGFGAAGEEGAEIGAALGAEAAGADDEGMFDDALDVLAEIPPDSAAAIILLEHRWAIPLRDAVYRANGFPVASTFVTPIDLVEIGLLKAEEAAVDQALLSRADTAKSESELPQRPSRRAPSNTDPGTDPGRRSTMFGASRRVARRTARRTSRRQMAMYSNQQGGDDGGYDEPAPQQSTLRRLRLRPPSRTT